MISPPPSTPATKWERVWREWEGEWERGGGGERINQTKKDKEGVETI
jgi:hypothetical protein